MLDPVASTGRSGGSRSCIYGPRNLEDGFRRFWVESEIQQVLDQIGNIYSRVNVDKEYLSTGFCFGLLDPVTNVLVNSLLYPAAEARKLAGDVSQPARAAAARKQAGDMNQLSLDSLVAFLTYLFPYLPEAEAVGYLRISKADPIVAALSIFFKRGLWHARNSEATSAAVVTALRCAVAAVGIGKAGADTIVNGWLGLDLPKLASLGACAKPEITAIAHVIMNRKCDGFNPGAQLSDAMMLAEIRWKRKHLSHGIELLPAIGTMKRLLLARIHGYYLQALSIFPTDELRKRYHRSMLMGGYCYGPLLHPVANIIVNTIWYEQNFPTSKQPEVEMISTKCLWRVAARSLYGLVSFLCTRYHLLTPELALQRLLAAGASLQKADPHLVETLDRNTISLNWIRSAQVGSTLEESRRKQRSAVEATTHRSASVKEAYAAAAIAAFHPSPYAQQEFLGSSDSYLRLKFAVQPLQMEAEPDMDLSGRILSSKALELLSVLFTHSSSHQQQVPLPLKLKKWAYPNAVRCEEQFWGQQERVKSMVTAALAKFSETKKQPFELHVICGVNELVGTSLLPMDRKYRCYSPRAPALYERSHVNFLAVPKGQPSAAVLFFAEYNNYKEDGNSYEMDEDSSYWCAPMSLKDPGAEQARCIYCEQVGSRIVHPIRKGFCGRDKEFEKVLLGEAPFFGSMKERYENDALIIDQTEDVDWVYDLKDDSIYTEYCVDEEDNDDDGKSWARHVQVL